MSRQERLAWSDDEAAALHKARNDTRGQTGSDSMSAQFTWGDDEAAALHEAPDDMRGQTGGDSMSAHPGRSNLPGVMMRPHLCTKPTSHSSRSACQLGSGRADRRSIQQKTHPTAGVNLMPALVSAPGM